MRVHPGVGESDAGVQCRTLIGGLGTPGLRDLDFGRQVVGYLQHLDWPEEVVVEDLSCSAHLALHRLQELCPAKVVLMGTAARGVDPPGTVRRYRLDLTPPSPEQVHQGLTETLGGMTDLDHTLAVVRHWGGFPVDTIVIEVEPSDCSFGPGFSEELGECIDPILAMVREELNCEQESADHALDRSLDEWTSPPLRPPTLVEVGLEEPSSELMAMAEYARGHERRRLLEPYLDHPLLERLALPAGLDFAVRNRPWGVGLGVGGDWYEFVPLRGGKIALVVGNVVGRGAEAVATMSELRTTARAYALLEEPSPAHLVSRLDRLVEVTGLGELTSLTSLVLSPDTGEIRLCNAGQCSPLMLCSGRTATFVEEGASPPLGAWHRGDRPEATVWLAPGATLLLFTEGLVKPRQRSVRDGMERLARAAANAALPLDELCDHVLAACLDGVQRDDDVLLLALRFPLLPDVPQAPHETAQG